MTEIMWSAFVDLLTQMRGKMSKSEWQAIRDEAFTRRARGKYPVLLADLAERLV